MRPTFLVAIAVSCLTGCNANTSEIGFSIDNPTEQTLKVTVDGKSYDIPAHGEQKVSLKPGPHTLASTPSGAHRFIVFSRGRGAVINPTFSTYVIVSVLYATKDRAAEPFTPDPECDLDYVTTGSRSYAGEFAMSNSFAFGGSNAAVVVGRYRP
jgi:hypothetical protein